VRISGRLPGPGAIGAAAGLAMLAATSIVEGSLVAGVLRAGFEAVAFAACFVTFRRYLALTG